MRAPLVFTSADTITTWAENQARTLDAVDLIVSTLQWDRVMEGDYPAATALQAAVLLLAEARVTPRMLLEEADFARRVDAARQGGAK